MSERWGEEAAAVQQPAPDGVTAGTLLRRAREAAGLHVAALAVSLKVPVKKLEALEDDRWDLLPDMVFVRALAFSVCRTLKIDPQPIVERLPQMIMPRLVRASDGINTPFRAPSDGAPPTWFDQLTKPVYLAVFALLLGALVLILLPRTQQEKEKEKDGSQVATAGSQPAAVNGEVVSAPQPFVIPPPAPASSPAAMPQMPPLGASAAPAMAAVAPTTAPMAAPVATSVPAKAASGATASASAPAMKASAPASAAQAVAISPTAAASGIVVFRAKGTSWVEVTDAKGVVAMRKEMRAGEAAGASGVLPLQVTIGRVDQTDVQVRGKAFDLRPVSKDNVARFTVK